MLAFIGNATGINITYDKDFPKSQTYSIDVKGVTLEQALQHIMSANQAVFKVLNERSILVYQDTQPKRNLYEEQAIQVFYLSHADPAEMQTLLAAVTRGSPQSTSTQIQANKVNNSITVRASVAMLKIIDRIISANDRPRAEIVVDVEILEINRSRAKQYGLDLSAYSIGLTFSPEQRPESVNDSTMFNLNTVSAGISAADFYGSIPSAAIRFLESDTNTKVIAKPQIRGSEGEKLTLKLGTEVPVPSTTFTPIATGGTAYNPMTSFNYKVVGVSVEIEPRVTYDGDIDMKMTVEVSNLGADRNIAGQNLPSFGTRNATTRLRLRDGESNMLAGLLQETERKALKGLPLVMNVPGLKQLFSSNDETVEQTDIVMLLTPHIVRTHELTQRDMSPIYIGTQQNIGLAGPPPLIAAPASADPAPTPAGATPAAPVPVVAPAGRPAATGAGAATPGIPVPVAPAPAAPAPVRPPGEAPPTGVPPTAEAPTTVSDPPAPPVGGAAPSAAAPTPADTRGAGTPTQVSVGIPGPELMVAGGPYTFPIAVAGASRLNTITFALTFNPRVLRVRLVQEGSFMRQGGMTVSFDQKVDAATGRVDITISRTGDSTGATGAGMLAAIQFDAVSAGSSPLTLSGVATAPGGAPLALQLAPGMVIVR